MVSKRKFLCAAFLLWLVDGVYDCSANSEHSKRNALQVKAEYGRLPLSFEPNLGQAAPEVRFVSKARGYSLFLTAHEAIFSLPQQVEASRFSRHQPRTNKSMSPRVATTQALIRMALADSNPNPIIQGLQQLPGKSNYLIGSDPKKWRTGIPNYARVQYREVYPGIDLAFYGNQNSTEYDFVVAPGADPSKIKFTFQNIDKMRIDSDGGLIIGFADLEIRMQKPRIYQEAAAGRRSVAGRFKIQDAEVSFEVAEYDRTHTLIIDPVLSYSSLLSTAGFEEAINIAADSAGHAYIVGYGGTGFPTTSGSFQPAFLGGVSDLFVTKLNLEGSAQVYSTYIGGTAREWGLAIAVDSGGNAYVTGVTDSADYPVTPGAFQSTHNGGEEAFVTKLNASGSALVYSSFLGGTGNETGLQIAVDALGAAYLTGSTNSTSSFPLVNAVQSTCNGCSSALTDSFVTKVQPAGNALVYSTFFGGSFGDGGNGVAADSSGQAYVTGGTGSPDLTTTSGAFQTQFQNPVGPSGVDGFVLKLSSTGALVYSTYLGGNLVDYGSAVDVDAAGNAYVTGGTRSTNFPVTSGAYQTSNAGDQDAYAVKLNAAGSALEYSTLIGGSGNDFANDSAIDAFGNVSVIGDTRSVNFPALNAVQASLQGGSDAFITRINPNGTALVYSTYLGGSSDDRGRGLALDLAANTYVAGRSRSIDFPTTAGAFQVTSLGGADAFAAKISDSPSDAISSLQLAVETLATSGRLGQGEAQSLLTKLNSTKQVDAFIQEVEALLRSRRISVAQAQALIAMANRILDGVL